MTEIKHTSGPWEYVPGTENHGPYVVNAVGDTVCDFYTMTNPTVWAACNGAASRPFNFCGELAEDHARMVGALPEMLDALYDVDATATDAYDPVMLAKVQAAIAKAEGRA